MPNDQNSQGRRPHYQRGRRGADRRGSERRTPPQTPEQGNRDQVNVEQIMRDIRSRISRRHGIDLMPQQIQELAARRLEAILEPKHVKPALMEQMRRAAGEPIAVPAPAADVPEAPLAESSLYESHRGILRLLRRWLNPILKLFINPAPLVDAVNAQAKRSAGAATRDAELYAQQAEWNALHYEILQRMVTEISRTTIELQSLSMRMESLAAKVDFNERRVRGLESPGPARPSARSADSPPAERPRESAPAPESGGVAAEGTSEGTRRRRRRRRGRRGTGALTNDSLPADAAAAGEDESDLEPEGDGEIEPEASQPQYTSPHADSSGGGSTALEPAHAFSLLQPVERHPSTDAPREPSPEPSSSDPAPSTPFNGEAARDDDGAPGGTASERPEPDPDER